MYTTYSNSSGFNVTTRLEGGALKPFLGLGSFIEADLSVGIVANIESGADTLIEALAASKPGSLPQEVILDNRMNRAGIVTFQCLTVGSYNPPEKRLEKHVPPLPPLALSEARWLGPNMVDNDPSFHYAHMFRRPNYYGRDTFAIWADHFNYLSFTWDTVTRLTPPEVEYSRAFVDEVVEAYRHDPEFIFRFRNLLV